MPRRALRPCGQQGCSALVERGRCPAHQREKDLRYSQQRGTASQRGYDRHWQAYSKTYRRDHPMCMVCQVNPSEQVDHIIPVIGPRDPLFWDSTNHQALCMACHSRKTVVEDKRGIGMVRA